MKIKMFAMVGVLAFSAVACGGDKKADNNTPPATTSGATIVQATDKLTFVPKAITAKVGDTIEWRNGGTLPHTVTFKTGGTFDQALDAGKSVTFTTTAAGTIAYMCKVHQVMTGTITVA